MRRTLKNAVICLILIANLTIVSAKTITIEKIEPINNYHDIETKVLEETTYTVKQDLLYVPGELIIKLNEDDNYRFSKDSKGIPLTGDKSIDNLNSKFKAMSINKLNDSSKPDFLSDVYKFCFPEKVDIDYLAKEYSKLRNVVYAEPNYIYYTCEIPNDPFFNQQWSLNQPNDFDIDAPEAWDIENGSSDVVIAILDTGVDYNHPDLEDNIWINEDEIPGNFRDDDQNGYIDDVIGYDFVHTTVEVAFGEDGKFIDNDPMDFAGHGTHCAGIAGAVTNNGIGIAGVCWNAKIMAVRAGYSGEDDIGRLDSEAIVLGMRYAVKNGANVISMSFGGPIPSLFTQSAIEYAYENGVVLIAAAGNEFTDKVKYPAVFDEVISVAATNQQDNRADFSNYGSWIDVAAPGVSINSTYPDNSYKKISGTSMACPMVAGLAGLILSKNNSLSPDDVRTIIEYSIDRMDPYDLPIRRGRVNAFKAMQRGTGSGIAKIESPDHGAELKGTIGLRGTTSGGGFRNYTVEYTKGPETGAPIWLELTNSNQTVENGLLYSLNTEVLDEGLYTIRLRTICDDGIYEDTIWIIVNNEINTFIVDDDGGPGINQTSIRWAVMDTANGDSVYVYNGTYHENLRIYKSINVQGESKENTVITGIGDNDVILVSATSVNISGFTINESHRGVFFYKASDSIFFNNIVKENWIGIKLSHSTNITITKNNITENVAFGILLTRFSNKNKIIENNFIDTIPILHVHAYFRNSWLNKWEGNYWDNWIGLKREALRFIPKRIPGKIFDMWPDLNPPIFEDVLHPRLTLRANYDWTPAIEPNEI